MPEGTEVQANLGKAEVEIAGFRLRTLVGRGGMGAVYRATQLSVDRIVAVKVLRPRLAQNKAFIARFREEAKAAARLNHPNIVQAIDAGEDKGYYYFAMEFVDGETLHRMMLREGILPEQQAMGIARDVAIGLSHARTHNYYRTTHYPLNHCVPPDMKKE